LLTAFTLLAAPRLELAARPQYYPLMPGILRSSKVLVALAAFCVLYAGPVAACVCAMDAMSEMPCCPDQGPDAADCALPDAQVGAVCDPVSADALTSASLDFSAAPAVVTAPLHLWPPQGPPRVPIPSRQLTSDDTPIYLVTLRLRI
jgi:hypothetical protein